jgi:hypothetical protein
MLIFLQLYAAHLVADFVLQPGWMALDKRRMRPLLGHWAIHVLCGCALVNVGLHGRALVAIVALASAHALLDHLKARLSRNGLVAFIVDQVIHLACVSVAALWLTALGWSMAESVAGAIVRSPRVYLILTAYVGVIFGGGFLVQKITQSFLRRIEGNVKALKPGLPQAGMYIGWVERFLLLTFVTAGFKEAIGFLLALKALARFPEIKDDPKGHFAEYFLVGTLTSAGLALVGGFIVSRLLARF